MATEKTRISLSDFEREIAELEGSTESKNILIYGGPGSGKTVLAGTLPGRILFLAGEPGFISAARQGAKGSVRVIPDTATAVAAIEWLENGNYKKYDWIVIDGLSTLNEKFLLGYAAEAFDLNPAKRAHRNLPDKPDYFNAQNFMKGWISRFVDLPTNVLITCHVMRMETDEGDPWIQPAVQGKKGEISNFISGLMYAVGYMSPRIIKAEDGDKEVRRILWKTSIKDEITYFAKDQFDAFGTFTDDLNMSQLLQLIEERGTGAPAGTGTASPNGSATRTVPAARKTTAKRTPARR